MKNLIGILTFILGLSFVFVQHSAIAAETKAAPEVTATAEAAKASPSTKKKRPHVRFACTTEECTCHGGADCNDLGRTHLCKIDMTCSGSTCRCSRN